MSCEKKICENSGLALNSALNIFAVPPTNVSVRRSFFREILPLSTISQEGPYLFRLFSNLWADLSRVYLNLEISLQRYNSTDNVWERITGADRHVAPIQMIGSNFIQQLIVSVGTTEVYNSGTLYPYKSYLTHELSYPSTVKDNFLAASGYYSTDDHDDRTDSGFEQRAALFSAGLPVHLLSRLDFDLSNQEFYLLNQIDVLFTLYRARDDFLLQTLADAPAQGQPAAPRYRIFMHGAKLLVKMIDVQPSLNMSIYQALEKQPATYSVRKTELK